VLNVAVGLPPPPAFELLSGATPGMPEMVIRFILMGFTGLSSLVLTFEIFTATSIPSMIFPKTGCLDCPGENQSRFALSATFMKNCDPPVFGEPVLAMDSVPGLLESREMFSSLMLPPLNRRSFPPVFKFVKLPSGGPPVPARLDCGSLAWGQPN